MPHKQTLVKVNAHVDEKIAPLIEALNCLPDVVTFESCETWQPGQATVLFSVGYSPRDWQPLAEMCSWLAEKIAFHADEGWDICIQWYSQGSHWGRLTVDHDCLATVTGVIAGLVGGSAISPG